ncbi:MAG: ABC transporter permease, partial [Terriglobales bacterium]
MNFELFIAARYLRAKRRQAVISVITAISVIGVTAGVASLIIALAINNGFRQDLQQRLLGSTSHVSLMRTAQDDGFLNWPAMMERLSKQPHVVAASPAIYEQVLISRGARAKGVILKGIIPEQEEKVSGILKTVTVGSADQLRAPPEKMLQPLEGSQSELPAPALAPIVLGKELAQDIGATVGSVVLVTSPQGELT